VITLTELLLNANRLWSPPSLLSNG